MKKIFIFILGILVSISSFFCIDKVKADVNDTTLTKDVIPDIYAVYQDTDRTRFFYAQILRVNNDIAYCIELGVDINTNIYSSTSNLEISNLPKEKLNYIRLLAYYGYNYTNHKTNKYYLATQELIWELVGNTEIYWVQGLNANGPIYDLEDEKNTILSLVNNHSAKPSFNNKTTEVVMGDTIELTDSNNVLSNYEIYNSNGNKVTIKNNKLIIEATTENIGNNQIQLIKKQYTSKVNLTYYSGNNQKMISSGYVDPVISTLNLKVIGGKITIEKLDKDNQTTIAKGDATLIGAIYGIYNTNDELIDKLTISNDYTATSKELPIGNYKIKEITPSTGYTLDEEIYLTEITKDNLKVNIKVYEKVIERKIELSKFYAQDKTGILTPEIVQFGFYNSKGEEVGKVTTNNQGYTSITLPYGTYTIKQLTTTKNHEKVEDFTITINENSDEIIRYTMTNSEIKAKLKVIKVDKDTGQIIKRSNIKFKIFDIQTNEYICQKVTYPKTETLCEFKTDENGVLITPSPLKSGIYKLEEVEQIIDGYLWNKEAIEFEIGEQTELINDKEYGLLYEINFSNQEVKGQVEINKFGEDLIIENGNYQYIKNNLAGITIGIYADEDIYNGIGELKYKKDTLITTIETDEDGYAIVNNLYLGKYYAKEISTLDNYVLSLEKYKFELKYQDQYTEVIKAKVEIQNYLKKGTLEFTKVDLSTSKPLPNTKIEIYTEEDILIYSGYTDNKGKIILDNLFIGKYYIIEKEAPKGYVLNTEKMWFEILDNSDVVKCTMTNEMIIEVPNTGIYEINIKLISSLIFIGIGVSALIYGIKKKNKK